MGRDMSPLAKPQVETGAAIPEVATQHAGVNQETISIPQATPQATGAWHLDLVERSRTSLHPPKVDSVQNVSSAMLSHKRPVDNDGEHESGNDSLYAQSKRPRLTRKNLALLNRITKKQAKKKTLALDAQPESTKTGTTSTTTTTTTTTSSDSADPYEKNGILPPRRSKRPINYDDIVQRLARSRKSTSPSESDYKGYVRAASRPGTTVRTLLLETVGELLKKYCHHHGEAVAADAAAAGAAPVCCYPRVFQSSFTGFPKDVGLNNGLPPPRADLIEGLGKEEYYPFPVEERIKGAALFKNRRDSPVLPHFAGQWTGGAGKDMEAARRQSAYDGAALVYGRSRALDAIGKPYLARHGHAKVTTFTTDGTVINFFAHYADPASPPGEEEDIGIRTTSTTRLEYHQYPIASTNLCRSFEEFKLGRRQLRNAQEAARAECLELRDRLREYWQTTHGLPETEPLPPAQDESHRAIGQKPQGRPAGHPPQQLLPSMKPVGTSHFIRSLPPPAMEMESDSANMPGSPPLELSKSQKRAVDCWLTSISVEQQSEEDVSKERIEEWPT